MRSVPSAQALEVPLAELAEILDDALGGAVRAESLTDATALYGVVPEIDSLAVVDILLALEERYDITIADDEVDEAVFATVGSLRAFAYGKRVERLAADR